ncbi:MAG TPA: DUF3352 domain-containing protein, partial [Candidatus Binatus sp.]|nr:DUF3352 domain-containing protein [Candidatus Binatus sp.]
DVKAALDAHADHHGMDGVADYRAARDRMGGDRLATLYVSRTGMGPRPGAGLGSAIPTLDPAVAQALSSLPAWLMAGIRAEDDALVADVVTAPYDASALVPGTLGGGSAGPDGTPAPVASLLTAPPAHASQIAPLVPGDTALLYELHGGGVVLQNVLTELRSTPGMGASLGQLDATLATLGGAQGLLGWVGDAGLVVMPDGATATAGIVLVAPDAATASAKVDQVRGLLGLAGLGGGITVTTTTIGGTTVTLVDLGDAASLLGTLGPLVPTTTGGAGIPPGTHVVVSLAAHGSTVLIGAGESFARRILETAPGSTLADQASYRTALALAPAQNDGQLFIAAGPAIALAERAIPASDQAGYDSDVKPYLASLDALLETTTGDAGGLRIRLVLTAR